MKSLVNYFIQHFNNLEELETTHEIRQKINRLNRNERSALRNELFAHAKIIGHEKNNRVVIWLQTCFQLIDNYSYRFNKVYFSPGKKINESLVQVLQEAKKSLDICMFTITHYELAKEIIACKSRNVQVRVLTDDEKTMDKGSEIWRLVKSGIKVKIDNSKYHMHNKFGIIDKRVAFTGSFNWTYTATKHNQENLLVTSNYDIVQHYQEEFNRLWTDMFPLKT